MASKKKQINWVIIKRRYLSGEKPKDIAKDYDGLTSKQIRDKAHHEGWLRQKSAISDKVEKQIVDEMEQYQASCFRANQLLIEKFFKAQESSDPLLYGSAKLNPLTKLALEFGLESLKNPKAANATDPSRPVYRSVYSTSQPDAASTGNFASKAILPMEGGDPGSSEWEDDGSD